MDDSSLETVNFSPPPNLPAGTYTVTVVASGVSSVPDPANLISISTVGPMYVDSSWNATTPISDADPLAPGVQQGTFGVNCFNNLHDAIMAAGTGGAVVVNGSDGTTGSGNFNESVVLNNAVTVYVQRGPIMVNTLAGTATGARIILASPNVTLTTDGDSAHPFDGAILGLGAANKVGSGTLTLNGNASTGGAFTIDSGTVVAAGAMTGAGGVTINPGGTLRAGTANGLAGTTVTMNVANGLDLNSLLAASVGGLIGNVPLSLGTTTLTVGSNGASSTFDGVISDCGGIVKAGNGTFTLTNVANSYTAGTIVTGGTLVVPGDGALGNAAGGLTLDGGTLETTANITMSRPVAITANSAMFDPDPNTTLTLSNLGANAGPLIKHGTGSLVLPSATSILGQVQADAGTIFASGTLTATQGVAINDAAKVTPGTTDALKNTTVYVNTGGILDLGGVASANLGGLAGSGAVDLNAAALSVGWNNLPLTYSGTLTGGRSAVLAKVGTATWALDGQSTSYQAQWPSTRGPCS